MKLFWKLHYVISIPERYRQTDGRTTYCGSTALCIASRGKMENSNLRRLLRRVDVLVCLYGMLGIMTMRLFSKCTGGVSYIISDSHASIYNSPVRRDMFASLYSTLASTYTLYTLSQKTPTFVTTSSINIGRFSKCIHCFTHHQVCNKATPHIKLLAALYLVKYWLSKIEHANNEMCA